MVKLMRLVLVVAVLIGVGVVPAASQTIGFKIGPTFSKLSIEEDPSAPALETLMSFGGGGFIRFGFAGLSLQAEVLALTKGFTEQFDDFGGSGEAKLKMNYVEVPVTAMFSLGAGPYLFAGPSVAFEVSCEGEIEDDTGSIEADCDSDPDAPSNRKKIDFSLTGGAGFEIPLGPGRLLLEGRYIYGLVNINDDPNEPAETKHRTWAAFAGFAIPIGFR